MATTSRGTRYAGSSFRRAGVMAVWWHLALCASAGAAGAAGAGDLMLFDFGKGFGLERVEKRDVKAELVSDEKGAAGPRTWLRIESGHATDWPGLTLKAPKGKWDLSRYAHVALAVRNVGGNKVTVHCRVDNPGGDGRKNCVTGHLALDPGRSGTLVVAFGSGGVRFTSPVKIVGMRGTPGGVSALDPANVTQLLVFVAKPREDHAFEIANIRAGGRGETRDAEGFFPFIDELGQYIHRDWPGKTHSVEELGGHIAKEVRDIAKNPGPEDRGRFGGWASGPKLGATGFFRALKRDGRWWLVDPDGSLFWSHGIDCVNTWSGTTPISERRDYFRGLPAKGSPLAQFYGKGSWAPHGYYKGKKYETYKFREANLLRKYGRTWRKAFADITHKRLHSWCMNTIANWSDSRVYLERKTPYVATIHYGARSIEGSKGFWRKFPDAFDPGFPKALRERLAKEKGKSAGDPWCVGFFVDNELSWGNDTSLALGVLASPPDQAAKQAFVSDLRVKYETVAKLNAEWGTRHASWDELLQSRTPPGARKAGADLRAFYTRLAEEYFRICREEVKRIAPENLYLGCRFAWVNERAVRAAAKHCDVVSYNFYRYDISRVRLPGGVDKPVIVGEFHFGALDRGMFHTGLKVARDQADRAAKYRSYVRGALRNPLVVGTHWFQYGDQATTGRGDGENYQIGFVDICDTPYPEIVAVSREVGYGMYEYRSGGK